MYDNIIDDILDSSVRNNMVKVIRRDMNDDSIDVFETVRLFFNYDDNVVFL